MKVPPIILSTLVTILTGICGYLVVQHLADHDKLMVLERTVEVMNDVIDHQEDVIDDLRKHKHAD